MDPTNNPMTALALPAPQAIELWRNADWQRLWLSLQAKPWLTLALVPASRGAPTDFALNIAVNLSRTGMMHLGAPIQVADGTTVQISSVLDFMEEINFMKAPGDRVLIALAATEENPVSETLARSSDAALLCVLFENMTYGESKRTLSKIGKERFLGSTVIRPESPATPAR